MTVERRLYRETTRTRREIDDLVLPEVGIDLISPFLSLPALRAFYPMSAVDYTAQAMDIAGGAYHLTNTVTVANDVDFGYEGSAPTATFDGTCLLERPDGGAGNWADILGNESFIDPTQRGLTFGGWFKLTADTGAGQSLIGKETGAGLLMGYRLAYIPAFTCPRLTIGNGAGPIINVDGTAGTTGLISFNDWYFWWGRFIPNTQIDIGIGPNYNTLAAGIPAALNDTASPFYIGARGGALPTSFTIGKAATCFLCACAVSLDKLGEVYEETRAAFGV